MFVYMLTVCSGNRAASPSLESAAESGLWDLITHGCHQQHSLSGAVKSPSSCDHRLGLWAARLLILNGALSQGQLCLAFMVQPCIITLTTSRCVMSQHGQIPGLKCTQLQPGCEPNSLTEVELSCHNPFERFSVKIQKCVCLFPPFPF